MCTYWNKIKSNLRRGMVLYKTRLNSPYKFDQFTTNRLGEEVVRYSIPKRDSSGMNFKSIPSKVFCKAKSDSIKGVEIDVKWLKSSFIKTYNAGGCNLKVLQSVLAKIK